VRGDVAQHVGAGAVGQVYQAVVFEAGKIEREDFSKSRSR
jgi:hypothetical protein